MYLVCGFPIYSKLCLNLRIKIIISSLNILAEMNNSDSNTANFVQKTFDILQNPQYHHIITWQPSGKQFAIRQAEVFQDVILPKFFRHRNVNSFIRQLNMYGFHKCRKEPTRLIFSHPYFMENRQDLLSQVRRKIKDNQKEEGKEETLGLVKQLQITKKQVEIQQQTIMEVQKIMEEKESLRTTTKQTIFQEEPSNRIQKSIFPINSFFNLDFESQQLKSLISKSYIMDINPDIYQKWQDAPSLKQIGTQEYLGFCMPKQDMLTMQDEIAQGLGSNAVRIFDTINYIFQLDI